MADKAEMVEIFDKLGHPTGQVLDKAEAHRQGLRHAVAHLWVYDSQGRVLLQRRSMKKEAMPGRLDISVGGHIPAGEAPEQAACREAAEEIGLAVTPADLQFIGITSADDRFAGRDWMHRTFEWTYLLQTEAATVFTFADGEVSEVTWQPLDAFEADIRGPKRLSHYSAREQYVYQFAITEIRKRLAV